MNCTYIAVAANGQHLAVSCGHGNTPAYDTIDDDPLDVSSSFGAPAGAYPTHGSFSADSSRFINSTRYKVRVFDVASHALLADVPPATSSPCAPTATSGG